MPDANRLILFAHGAGAPSSSAWMRGWAARLRALGRVARFDYPYMRAKRKRPDPHDTLVAAHREALRRARREGEEVVLAGKSMGSRIGCHLALEEPIDALVCFGYPLVGQNGKERSEVLLALRAPILFLQGTRDPLCPLPRLEQVRRQMTAPNELFVVDGGDHSLAVLKRGAVSQAQADEIVLAAISAFLDRWSRPQERFV